MQSPLSLCGYMQRGYFAPLPKVSREHSTEDMLLQNCPCLPPHRQYCKEFGSAALSVFFFSQKNVPPCVLCSFPRQLQSYHLVASRKTGLFFHCNSIFPILWDSWENLIKMSARRMAGDSFKGLIQPQH